MTQADDAASAAASSAWRSESFSSIASVTDMASMMKRGNKRTMTGMHSAEVGIVTKYNVRKQTVDVEIKTHPNGGSPIYKNVPILGGSDSEFGIIRPLRNKSQGAPTMGLLIFPRMDSRGAYDNRKQKPALTKLLFRGKGPLFIPGIVAQGTDFNNGVRGPADPEFNYLSDTVTNDANTVGLGDLGICHHSTGSRIIFKQNGDINIVAGGKLTVNGDEVSTGLF